MYTSRGRKSALLVHIYTHTNIHTYIQTYIQTYIRTYRPNPSMYTSRRRESSLLVHTYIHTYIHTNIHTQAKVLPCTQVEDGKALFSEPLSLDFAATANFANVQRMLGLDELTDLDAIEKA